MQRFSAAEIDYLTAERHLGRLATIDAAGFPHVVPLGFTYNAELGTIDISGRSFSDTKKFRNVRANPKVGFVVDDVLPPWQPRSVMVQGRGEAITAGEAGKEALIRIWPDSIVSWGLDVSTGA